MATLYNDQLTSLLQQTFTALNLAVPVLIELDNNPQQGDVSTNIAMKQFKTLEPGAYHNPRALATAIAEKLQTLANAADVKLVDKVEVAGPGFINISLSEQFLKAEIGRYALNSESILPNKAKGKKAIVEYSSPNIAKPFTIGHLRSSIIGQAVANLLTAMGYEVFRDNHMGDWGTQFGKQIYALHHLGEGSLEKNIAKLEATNRPVEELVKLYVEFHALAEERPEIEEEARLWFKKLEDGDQEARALWQKCIDWSMKEFRSIYSKLGVSFTENPDNDYMGYGESFFEDKMGDVVKELQEKKLLQEGKEGAQLVFYPNDELPPLMILKKDGATLYATRDLATDKFRLKHYGKDLLVVNEVGAEQATYFQQIFKLEEMLGWYELSQRVHVKHGMYRFKDKKMSTRKGNVIWLEEVLDEAQKRAFDLTKDQDSTAQKSEIAQKVGIGALKWNDLKRSSQLDVVFDWDEILNMKGNSGPYLQYAVVRCLSILEKAKTQQNSSIAKYIDSLPYILMQSENALIKALIRFPLVVEQAATEYAPHHLCTYLYDLAQSFSSFYTECPILAEGVEEDARMTRLALTQATANVLQTGLKLLGIETVEKM